MSKYRIIKSIAANKEEPYFPQYWDAKQARWGNFEDYGSFGYSYCKLSYESLKAAKQYIQKRQEQDVIDATPAAVVWEEEDV